MIADILAVYNLIKETVDEASILSALFSFDGTRKEGDEAIKVKINKVSDSQWFYEIEPYEDYILIPFPVNQAVHVDYGLEHGSQNPSVKFFRYVSSPLSRYSQGGEPNVKVDFFVFGYKPSDLMTSRKKKA